jgi:hypothetical protein
MLPLTNFVGRRDGDAIFGKIVLFDDEFFVKGDIIVV